jgi:hypothetical protein
MELMPVRIELIVRAKEAIAELRTVNAEMDKMAVKGELASGAMGRMQRAGALAGKSLTVLAGGMAFMAYEGIKANLALQTSQARLQVAIKNTGVSFAAAKPYVDKQAEAMMNLGFKTADTYEALGTMTTALRSPQMALDALGAAADLARYKHMSLAEASKMVARASMGQARGLGDLGLALNKNIPKGIAFADLMKLIAARTKDAATEFSKTSAGQLEVLRAKFEGLKEELGNSLLPILNKVTAWLIKDGLPNLEKFGKWFSNNKGIVVAFTSALAVLWAVPKITGILTVLTTLGNAYLGLAGKAAAAATAETAATGGEIGVGAAITGAGVAGGIVAAGSVGIAAAVGYGLYEAGTSKAKPTKPKIGGKAGGAAMARYNQQLAAWNKAHPAKTIPVAPKSAGKPNLQGLGPAPLIGKTTTAKKPSIKAMKKGGVAGNATTTHTNVLKLDSKVLAKSTATSATHGTPMATGHSK